MKIFFTVMLSMLMFFPLLSTAKDDVLTLSNAESFTTVDSGVSTLTYLYKDGESVGGNKRYVQVFVVDPDQNVPLKDSILYKSEQFFTDETDMEIRHSLNLTNLLDKHNKMRIKIKDKTSSLKYGRDIYLEPIKLRDLKVAVASIAKF